jgi:hypothetical protein
MSTDNIIMAFPYDLWSLIVDALIQYQDEQCEECEIDTRMLIDLIQQVLDGEVEPETDWVDTLNEYLRGNDGSKEI